MGIQAAFSIQLIISEKAGLVTDSNADYKIFGLFAILHKLFSSIIIDDGIGFSTILSIKNLRAVLIVEMAGFDRPAVKIITKY
jgi:hypothetical protein